MFPRSLPPDSVSAERKFSIVLFGATGFTGQYVLDELLASHGDDLLSLPMAIAGRCGTRLQELVMSRNAGDRVKVSSAH